MKTFFDIIKDVSNLRWSIVDPEPESFAEVQKAVKLAVAQAHNFIWNLDDFPFKVKKDAIFINANENTVLAPKGNIMRVFVDGANNELQQIKSEDADFLSHKTGKPEFYWVEFTDSGAVIKVFPTPKEKTTIVVRYISNMKAKDSAGNPKHNLEEMDDVLNLPNDASIEDIYLQCLKLKSMVYLVADETDENYKPYEKEFLEAYQGLLKLTGVKREPRLII
jgi:hypothetical protein